MKADADFSAPIALDAINRLTAPVVIEADAVQCSRLAERFALLAVERLSGTLALARTGDVVTIDGSVEAAVQQACAATGTAIPTQIRETVHLKLVPAATLEAAEDEAEMELDADALDIMGHDGKQIDLGAIIADTMALALDPFPRSPDADRILRDAGVVSEEEAGSFGALAALRDQMRGKD